MVWIQFFCVISDLHLFDQDQKLKLWMLPWKVYCVPWNRKGIPSAIPTLPLCPLLPSSVPHVLQPKWPKLSKSKVLKRMYLIYTLCAWFSWHSSNNNQENSYLKISGGLFTELFYSSCAALDEKHYYLVNCQVNSYSFYNELKAH